MKKIRRARKTRKSRSKRSTLSWVIPIIVVALLFWAVYSLYSKPEAKCPSYNIFIKGEKICLRADPELARLVPVYPDESSLREVFFTRIDASRVRLNVNRVVFLLNPDFSIQNLTVSSMEVARAIGTVKIPIIVAFTKPVEGNEIIMDFGDATEVSPIIYFEVTDENEIRLIDNVVLIKGEGHEGLDLAADKFFLTFLDYT